MTARVTVLVEHGDGRLDRWTGCEAITEDESDSDGRANGRLVINAINWRHVRLTDPRVPEPDPGPDTADCATCGQPIDRNQRHITIARHLEITDPTGTDVLEASAVAQYHPDCEPLNLPVLDHTHDIDAGGNCRDQACGFNSDTHGLDPVGPPDEEIGRG